MRCRYCTVSLLLSLFFFLGGAAAQTSPAPPSLNADPSVEELRQQVRELRAAVEEVRSDAERYREETVSLRHELDETRSQMRTTSSNPTLDAAVAGNAPPDTRDTSGAASQQAEHTEKLDEEFQLLSGKIDEQYQTKVESWSKYRVRFSGIVLFNLFSNQGTVDNQDIPTIALQNPEGSSGGSFGATLRQSELGFEVFGPRIGGARTSGNIRMDFGGGFATAPNGVNYGLSWLRTGVVRMDWEHTSVVAGQDALFFSPESPTSFASLTTPALANAGNLWSWTPQVRVEHRFELSDNSSVLLQGGVLDNLDGETPGNSYYRYPQAGESSRQPAYAARAAWVHTVFGQPLTVAAAGYYSRQDYGYGQNVNGWAGMTDWNLPLNRLFTLSGKFYRGEAIGGIGGGIGNSVYTNYSVQNTSPIHPASAVGGWGQFKFKPLATLEFNAAFGQDNPFASDVRFFPTAAGASPSLVRNQGVLGNVIYRPRADLLFSAEYHYLKTFNIANDSYSASQVNLMMGILF
jgi:hypothetical protein